MNFKKIKDHKAFSILTNRYVLVSLFFLIWMFFLDTNSFFIHRDVNQEKKVLERRKEDFIEKIETDKEKIKALEDEKGLESFARETYYIKKPEEEIYIIEEDSTENE
ncbi:MAG: septum formation initiator family protein [Flavobacteriaceae bacterium]|nr:septum formation initiator family protein [Flavobacteriaceae bacterium]